LGDIAKVELREKFIAFNEELEKKSLKSKIEKNKIKRNVMQAQERT
jgi:hypothetical protein